MLILWCSLPSPQLELLAAPLPQVKRMHYLNSLVPPSRASHGQDSQAGIPAFHCAPKNVGQQKQASIIKSWIVFSVVHLWT